MRAPERTVEEMGLVYKEVDKKQFVDIRLNATCIIIIFLAPPSLST